MPDPHSQSSDGTPRTPEHNGDPLGTTDDRVAKGPTQLRCPHCHNPVRLSDTHDEEVLCPGCGSSFRVRDARMTDTVSASKPLGKFRLMERVGQGAFGAVWKARDSALDRVVALKIPHTGLLTEDEDLERFHREARAAAQLRHPGIVTVHDVEMLDGLPVIVSEFVQGVTLKDFLEVRRLAFGEAAELVAALAEALEYAHTMGLVHRDIKPANIMIEATPQGPGGKATARLGKPLLMDFGLALRDAAEVTLTMDGHVIGTPAYMSPEQAAGKSHQADRRSDVYSLGVVLYELLAGELPFRGSKAMMLYQVLSEEPRSPRKLNDKIPRDLETVCLKCLNKDPARRYATAAGLAADLRRYLAGEPVQARPVGAVERVLRWVKRRPAVATLLGGVLAVTAAGGILVTWNWRAALTAAERERMAREDVTAKADELARTANAERVAKEDAKAKNERAELNLYLNRIALAQREWEANHVGRAMELLDACPVDRRGWEWRYLRRLCHGAPLTLLGHDSPVMALTFSRDGKRIVTASLDQTVKVWDSRTGQETFSLKGATGFAPVMAVSPDGTRIASAGITRYDPKTSRPLPTEVKVWDARTGQEVLSLGGHPNRVLALAFSPDGARIASASGEQSEPVEVKVWDARTGQEALALKGHTAPVGSVAFSPDGGRIASGAGDSSRPGEVKVWDARTGQEVLSFKAHPREVHCLAFSPDGTRLVSAGFTDLTVKLWDTRTGQQTLSLKGHTDSVSALAFSPDGTRIVSGSTDQTLRVWDARTGQEAVSFKGHTSGVSAVAFSPDGGRIASSGGYDQTVKVWDARVGQEALSIQWQTAWANTVAFSPDSTRIAGAAGDQTVRVWDARTGQEILSLKGHTLEVKAVAFSPDGELIASASQDQTVKVWDARTGQETLSLKGGSSYGSFVAFSPDGARIASAAPSSDPAVKVWDARTGQEVLSLKGHTSYVSSVAFSPDGTRIASGSTDQTVKLWDARTGQEVLSLKGHTGGVTAVVFSPDDACLASLSWPQGEPSKAGEMKIWDARPRQEPLSLKGHTGYVTSVAFSPDGTHIASGSVDQAVKLWETRTGQEVLSLKGHTSPVTSVVFSPDGTRIASASGNQSNPPKPAEVMVWDARTGQEILSLKGDELYFAALAFSADGTWIASASYDRTVKVWDARSGQEILALKGHTNSFLAVAFSPNGSQVSAWDGFAWKTWETASGRELPPRPVVAETAVPRAALSPDGRYRIIAVGSVVHVLDSQLQLNDVQRIDLDVLARDDPAWHTAQARLAEQAQDCFAGIFHLGRLLALKPDDPEALAPRGRLHAMRGQWPEAIADLTRVAELRPEPVNLVVLARVQSGGGKAEDYRATVRQLADRVARRRVVGAMGLALGRTTADGLGPALTALLAARPLPEPTNETIQVAALAVARPDVLEPAELLATAERGGPFWRGRALVRVRHFNEAATVFAGWEKWRPESADWRLFVALAEHGRGNSGKGRQAYLQATAWLDAPSKEDPKQTNFARIAWDLRIEVDVLRREVEEKLGIQREPGKMAPVAP